MADEKKIVTQDVFEKAISDVLQIVVDNVYEEEEYTEDEVSNLFDADKQTIDYYSSLISDTLVSENRIFSSKHVTDLLQQLQLDCNSYADEIATRNLTTEIVTATSEVTKENVLYLILSDSATNTYEQYMLIGGNATPLGSTKIDLSDVYTKSEMDTKLSDKANSSEVLAVNKVQTTTGSETNDTVYSSKLTKDELDKKANDSEVVKKTDISTTINSTSTNDKVAGAKAVNDKLSQYVRIDGENMLLRCTSSGTVFTDFIDKNCTSDFRAYHVVWNSLVSGIPCGDGYCTVYTYEHSLHKKAIAYDVAGNAVWEITQLAGVWGTWQQVRSGVTDVPITYINTFENEAYVRPIHNNVCSYYVTNGFCTVTIETECLSTSDDFVQILSGLPKPKTTVYSNTIDRQMGSNSGARATFQLLNNGSLRVVCNYGDPAITEVIRNFYVTLSYPVAES